ncbi:NAD(P)/FAD-dependent oxidoreductase [Gordonia sp. HNM0687]|uniref:NAD(P)/FAD-dependent oxidoreductase n=1 Tax=Gordonia mangrovi TaxID=2665643 RepID=A0A6L7GNS3_9ACTN|nr:NAD(P)/FAD-dependent oxidoreductase [Gordonia mangrovi]MXP21569.1 NAD(P)/FAD-dependent oxidoreductase [Gordonia mangrovi]UVF80311.1 NAD(P)/FAD-dependent oxidoreductase [Gordonia mangrovi]
MTASVEPQHIVIVGAGFAGFETARRLLRHQRTSTEHPIRVTVISPNDFMLYTPLLPDVAGGLLDPRFVAVPLADSLRGAELIAGHVAAVDLSGRTLEVHNRAGAVETVRFDRLVLTPGSVTRLFDIPGLAEHALGLKTTTEALYLRDRLLEQLELAARETDSAIARARRTVVVVGASYAGAELTAQLRALADEVARQRHFDPQEVRFVLLDMADRVMPEVGEKLSDKVLEVLRSRGIDIRLGTTIDRLTNEVAELSDGTTVATHTVAWAAGVSANPLIESLGLPTEKGRLAVRADLSVPDHPDVFAAGDAAAVPDTTKSDRGAITPPTAQHAVRQGKVLARNVLASIGVGTSTDYRHNDLGLVVDLGPRFAVANPVGVHLSGYAAKAVTRAYHLFSLPRGANRMAVAAAYLGDAVYPRPLVSFGLVDKDEASFARSEGIPVSDGR